MQVGDTVRTFKNEGGKRGRYTGPGEIVEINGEIITVKIQLPFRIDYEEYHVDHLEKIEK